MIQIPVIRFSVLSASLVLLLAMTSAASDFTLGIFGNANMDRTIDEKDIAFVEDVIVGKNAATNLSDANCDGNIDSLDIERIKEIMIGSEKEITITCNSPYKVLYPMVTVQRPVERIVVLHEKAAEAIRALQAEDKLVRIDSNSTNRGTFLSDLINAVPSIGSWMEPDIESILRAYPDIVIAGTQHPSPSLLEDKLDGTGISVVRMDLDQPITMEEEIMRLAYILDKIEPAKEFIYFYKGYLDKIVNRTETLP